MSAVWSVEQQRCLAALGYTLYRPATLPAGAHDADPALLAATVVIAVSERPAVASGNQASAAIDPLLRALLRAADLDHAQVDATEWKRALQIPSLTQLRNNPAAKRALWPRLRALRRERAPR